MNKAFCEACPLKNKLNANIADMEADKSEVLAVVVSHGWNQDTKTSESIDQALAFTQKYKDNLVALRAEATDYCHGPSVRKRFVLFGKMAVFCNSLSQYGYDSVAL